MMVICVEGEQLCMNEIVNSLNPSIDKYIHINLYVDTYTSMKMFISQKIIVSKMGSNTMINGVHY